MRDDKTREDWQWQLSKRPHNKAPPLLTHSSALRGWACISNSRFVSDLRKISWRLRLWRRTSTNPRISRTWRRGAVRWLRRTESDAHNLITWCLLSWQDGSAWYDLASSSYSRYLRGCTGSGSSKLFFSSPPLPSPPLTTSSFFQSFCKISHNTELWIKKNL